MKSGRDKGRHQNQDKNQDKEIKSGLIIKAISGYFYVVTEDKLTYTCRAKGAFRKDNQSPLAGDYIDFEVTPNEDLKGTVSAIKERKNHFRRPQFANLDTLFIIVSIIKPRPNLLNIDKLLAICEYKEIKPVIVFTKVDLVDDDMTKSYEKIYKKTGYEVIKINNDQPDNIDEVKEQIKPFIKDKLCGFAGNTGVGKSSLLNNISPNLGLLTGEISEKLGRGKHTTRCVELFYLEEFGGYVADTPGFGCVDVMYYVMMMKCELVYCFKEFVPYVPECKFRDCTHICESGCAVIQAVKDNIIASERHENYVLLYKEVENLKKDWEK